MKNKPTKKYEATWLTVIKDGKILLGLKKRGQFFGAGLYNGIGGKVEPNETVEAAMIRETQKEVNITPTKYINMGKIVFDEFIKAERANLTMHIFVATEFEGEPTESDEMIPEWFDLDKIPYDKCFPDDKYWLPLVLSRKRIEGNFKFDENFKLLKHEITEIFGGG